MTAVKPDPEDQSGKSVHDPDRILDHVLNPDPILDPVLNPDFILDPVLHPDPILDPLLDPLLDPDRIVPLPLIWHNGSEAQS